MTVAHHVVSEVIGWRAGVVLHLHRSARPRGALKLVGAIGWDLRPNRAMKKPAPEKFSGAGVWVWIRSRQPLGGQPGGSHLLRR